MPRPKARFRSTTALPTTSRSCADPPLERTTLLQLGTYTAADLPLQFPADVKTEADLLPFLKTFRPSTAPGTHRAYSNPSIGLLGRVTALALKTDYTSAIETTLLPALGLHHTFVRVPPAELPHYAWGQNEVSAKVRVSPGVFDAEAYGIKTTAADLLRLVELNLDPSALPPPWRRAIEQTHQGRYQVGVLTQGLGWEHYPYPCSLDTLLEGNGPKIIFEPQPATALSPHAGTSSARLFNKTGSTNGFGAYVVFAPTARLGIVLLSNRNYPIAARVRTAHALLQAIVSAAPAPESGP